MTTDASDPGEHPDDPDRYREGDRPAFARLWEQHHDDFRFWLQKHASRHAEDLLGDLAVKLLLPAVHGKYDPQKPWGGWAFTVLRNLTRDFMRRLAKIDAAAADPETLSDPGAVVYDDGLAADFDACLESLPPRLRQFLVERYLEGRPQTDIAVVMAVSTATVSKSLDKARTLLAECLRGKGHGDQLR